MGQSVTPPSSAVCRERSATVRFFLGGLLGCVFSTILLWSSAWVIGLIREGDQLFVAQTASGYFFLGIVFLKYGVPIGVVVSAVSAVIGKSWFGATFGIAWAIALAVVMPLGFTENGALAISLACCGVLSSKLTGYRFPYRRERA